MFVIQFEVIWANIFLIRFFRLQFLHDLNMKRKWKKNQKGKKGKTIFFRFSFSINSCDGRKLEATCYCGFVFPADLMGDLSNLLNQNRHHRTVHLPTASIGSRPCTGEYLRMRKTSQVNKFSLKHREKKVLTKENPRKKNINTSKTPHTSSKQPSARQFVLKIYVKSFFVSQNGKKRRKKKSRNFFVLFW